MATKEELEAAIAATEQQKANAIQDRDNLMAQRNNLETQKQTIENQIADTSQQIAAKEDQIAALNIQLADLNKQLAELPPPPPEIVMGPVGIAMGHWPAKDIAERTADIKAIKAVGFTWMRTGIGWAYTEKPAGTINTNTAKNIGTAMKNAGMKWLCMLSYTPLFYSTNPNNIFAAPKAEFYDEWERWVETQVRAIVATGLPVEDLDIEIWNEQNWFHFWEKPNPAVYVQLLKRAFRAVNKVNSKIPVSFGGMAPSPDRPPGPGVTNPGYRSSTFVRMCYEAGMTGADFDRMNIHPYNGNQPLSATKGKPWDMNTTVLNEVRKVMADNGNPGKRTHYTEFGYSTRGKNAVDETNQASLLVAQIDYLRKTPRAGVTYVFNWRELAPPGATGGVDDNSNGYGILRYDKTPKKAVAAIKAYLAKNPSVG